jgi:hypothetical protein
MVWIYAIALFILLCVCGLTDGNFNSGWSGEIEGQVLRAISGGEVPLAD